MFICSGYKFVFIAQYCTTLLLLSTIVVFTIGYDTFIPGTMEGLLCFHTSCNVIQLLVSSLAYIMCRLKGRSGKCVCVCVCVYTMT